MCFFELCSPNNTDEINDLIYDFVLSTYKKIRGHWFVKSMQAEQDRKLKEVEDLVTRTRVLVATEGAKSSSTFIINKNDKFGYTNDDDITNIVDGLTKLYISADNNLNGYDSNDDDNDNDNNNI